MDWPHLSPPNRTVLAALTYSDRFDYPLTVSEIWFWQIHTRFSKTLVSHWPYCTRNYCHLPGRSSLVNLRQARSEYSRAKLRKARRLSRILKTIPTIDAIFITGSLAMDNSPENDDIDVMFIVRSHCLWFTRAIIASLLVLTGLRRSPRLPEHSSPKVRDKICDNLYLDTDHLSLSSRNLYLAHEVLQAKCVFDRGEVHRRFLLANSWAENYLPIAYSETLKQAKPISAGCKPETGSLNILLFIFNFLLFTLQYLYMRPHITNEKIGLGYAFFHPGKPQGLSV